METNKFIEQIKHEKGKLKVFLANDNFGRFNFNFCRNEKINDASYLRFNLNRLSDIFNMVQDRVLFKVIDHKTKLPVTNAVKYRAFISNNEIRQKIISFINK